MKTNPNDLIHAELEIFPGTVSTPKTFGLTKREYFAGLVLQGLLSNPECGTVNNELLRNSIKTADALIAELNKSTEG